MKCQSYIPCETKRLVIIFRFLLGQHHNFLIERFQMSVVEMTNSGNGGVNTPVSEPVMQQPAMQQQVMSDSMQQMMFQMMFQMMQ